MTTVAEIASSLLIILFTYTAVSKFLDIDTFRSQLDKSAILTKYARIIVWFIPAIELITAGLLIIKRTRLSAFYISFFIMLIFSGYVYSILHLGYEIPCACGGVISSFTWNQHLILNIVFVFIALVGVLTESKLREDFIENGNHISF
ncbi:MAG TPA: MauE/DoxX family redox-associated membrane protein [Nitrosopumilaceae archaeon]|nr:MauE/DoxX family redox-associated membrane protein [Nitrosopumilaceae archaeon]